MASDRAASGAALRDIEACLAGASFQLIQRLANEWQGRRRFVEGASAAEQLLAVAGDWADPARGLAAVDAAIRLGALELARALLHRLRAQGAQLQSAQIGQLCASELELSLIFGEREAALALAERHRERLRASPAGVSLLTLLGEPVSPWLPDGRPNLLALSRRIAAGEVDAEQLASLLGPSRRLWLRSPELPLLFWSALWRREPERALAFLNGFLQRQGASPLGLLRKDPERNVLEQLGNQPPKRVATGPLVSVVVAAHNAGKTLAYAVDSLLDQTHQRLEVLIGDDASDDDTLQVMEKYAGEPRVRRFRSLDNQGAYNLRNALAARARGELLTFHDADDLALSTRIERQVACLERTRAVACATGLLRVRPDGAVVFFKNQKATRLSRVSLMLSPATFAEVGPFRSARFGADEELYARIARRFGSAAIGRIAAPLMLSLWAGASATQQQGRESLEDGYRSPLRRAYTESVFQRYFAAAPLDDDDVDRRLQETGNYAKAAHVSEI
ncbi:MAG TPA: glycosyltransferase family A protein [Polyangiaceae bacterium]|nr:glycosyltransferase family A protein [Polyangiaceae bacterium]